MEVLKSAFSTYMSINIDRQHYERTKISWKELSLCQNFPSLQSNVVDIGYLKLNSVRSNNISLKYQKFTPSGYQDIGIQKFETQLLFSCI